MNTKIIFNLINLLYISIITTLIINSECYIQEEELTDFFEYMTLDRIRQIYWNIVIDIDNHHVRDLGQVLTKSYAEEYLHSLPRKEMISNLANSLYYLYKFDYYLDIELFKKKLKEIELFLNLQDLISENLPKNFLVNFVINIDKYERIKENKVDGISDYINYYTKEKIIKYIIEKIEEDDELKSNFKEIIFNNRILNYKDLNEYIQNKKKEELIQIIYGFENYFFNEKNISEVLTYERYDHEFLINRTQNDLFMLVVLYSKEASIINIDDFITIIENRNFHYINNIEYLRGLNYNKFNYLLALEKYHKIQNNLTQSLKGLIEYTEKMPKKYQQKVLRWGLSIYPELYESGRFQDIMSNEINYQYGQVKEFVQVTERNILLRYAYNIHTFQNKIESIYNNELYNIFRYKNEKLYELIFSDTNLNKNLQLKSTFINFADLHKEFFCKYLENLERNQLKKIERVLIDLYFEEKVYEIDSYQRPSELLSRIEYAMYSDTFDLLYEAENFVNNSKLNIQNTSIFFKSNKKLLKEYVNNYFGYYYNIMDFLRSTNIFYLNIWLMKYETIIRKQELYSNIEGGLKTNFLNEVEYTKKDILEQFDIYLEEYPELFEPKKFIEIIGMNNDKTPHKRLIELFYNISNENNKKIIMNIAYSLTGHYQRKNIQTSFDVKNFLYELNNSLYNNPINYEGITKYLFQFFRIINIFPELENSKIFEKICLNNDTRVISLYEENYLKLYFERDIIQLAKNIQYYLNNTNNYDEKNIDKMNEEELKKYILDFSVGKLFTDNYDLQSRILDGDFYPIIYDYYENYLNNIDEEHFNFIYNNIKLKCLENFPCKYPFNSTNLNEKKKEIINNIKNVQEFQDPQFFDRYFDYISKKDGDEFYQFLVNLTNKDLKLYTIIANIIKIEVCNKNINTCKLYEDIYFKIHYMSRNEMIRYIFKIKELKKDLITAEMLPILVNYYMLGLGSDNIYDLTLY